MIQIDLERNTTSNQGAAGSAVTWFDMYKQQQCPIILCGMYMVVVPAYSYQIIDIEESLVRSYSSCRLFLSLANSKFAKTDTIDRTPLTMEEVSSQYSK